MKCGADESDHRQCCRYVLRYSNNDVFCSKEVIIFKAVKCLIYSFRPLIRNNAVPRGCWDFCRGRTPSVEVAAATGLINGVIDDCMPHMTTIGKCFQEGQYTLPGPPSNLQV